MLSDWHKTRHLVKALRNFLCIYIYIYADGIIEITRSAYEWKRANSHSDCADFNYKSYLNVIHKYSSTYNIHLQWPGVGGMGVVLDFQWFDHTMWPSSNNVLNELLIKFSGLHNLIWDTMCNQWIKRNADDASGQCVRRNTDCITLHILRTWRVA